MKYEYVLLYFIVFWEQRINKKTYVMLWCINSGVQRVLDARDQRGFWKPTR